MKFLNVLKSFKLNLAEGVIRDFEAGLHEVEDEIAAHWYVVANSEPLTTKQAKSIQSASTATGADAVTGAPAQVDNASADISDSDAASTDTTGA